ncbi:MAG: DNA methyltransferase [Chloroflexi bacterium]|nr:DNA methyltransferase [Chloroflexota bacterium]
MIERHHYLHSLAGGTRLTFGIFVGGSLLGALTFGVGSFNAASLVDGATSDDVLTLSRLWLSDDLPRNSESRVIGVVLRELRRHTSVRFLLSYADPAQGHLGVVYQATGWLYTGLSEPMPLFDLGDGIARHSRSVSHAYGSHSIGHFRRHGVTVKLIPQAGKHRYVFFIDPSWRSRLRVPVLPYPGNKKEKEHECH